MTKKYETPEQAKQDQSYLEVLAELIYQLADDDLLISHRGSEWLGLAPHIEEDVAFSSITQDTMGHAAMYYQMLEELGFGKADDIAQLRKPEEYRNAILTERMNGTGHYKEDPDYDWGYAIIRNYTYEVFKKIRLESLEKSSFAPLAQTAQKIKREQFYHLYHWEVWIDQLSHSTEEAHSRLQDAVNKTWEDVASLFDFGPKGESMVQLGLIDSEAALKEKFINIIQSKFDSSGLVKPNEFGHLTSTGREGIHSAEFLDALNELNEVYKLDPQANW